MPNSQLLCIGWVGKVWPTELPRNYLHNWKRKQLCFSTSLPHMSDCSGQLTSKAEKVQDPNLSLQLWESWGHCLRSTCIVCIIKMITKINRLTIYNIFVAIENVAEGIKRIVATLQKALNFAGGTQRTTPVLKTRKCVVPKCWNIEILIKRVRKELWPGFVTFMQSGLRHYRASKKT